MLIQSIFENQSSFSPSSVLNDHSLVKLISKQKQNSKEFLAGNSVRKFHDLEAPKRFNNYAERSKEIVCGEEKFVLSFLVTCLDLQASLLGTGILDHTLKSFSLSICLVPHQEFQSVYLSLPSIPGNLISQFIARVRNRITVSFVGGLISQYIARLVSQPNNSVVVGGLISQYVAQLVSQPNNSIVVSGLIWQFVARLVSQPNNSVVVGGNNFAVRRSARSQPNNSIVVGGHSSSLHSQ